MKTLGRILLILSVFTLTAGLLYAAVALTTNPSVTTSRTQFERPLPEGDEHFDNDGGLSGEWLFGTVKNLVVVAVVVALVNTARAPYQRKRLLGALRLR